MDIDYILGMLDKVEDGEFIGDIKYEKLEILTIMHEYDLELVRYKEKLFMISVDPFYNRTRYKWGGTVEDFHKMRLYFDEICSVDIIPKLILCLLKNSNIEKRYSLK